jgi:hypothetical protein
MNQTPAQLAASLANPATNIPATIGAMIDQIAAATGINHRDFGCMVNGGTSGTLATIWFKRYDAETQATAEVEMEIIGPRAGQDMCTARATAAAFGGWFDDLTFDDADLSGTINAFVAAARELAHPEN